MDIFSILALIGGVALFLFGMLTNNRCLALPAVTIAIILMSFFFAILSIGSKSMELTAGVSSELILIVQSIIIFFMAAESGIRTSIGNWWSVRKARRASRKEAA